MIKNYINDLKSEFKGYNKTIFLKDLMAGLTVTAVALPLALAFGVSSGADAASGLITAIIGGIIMSLLAGAFYQISGPTGAMSAILLPLVAMNGIVAVFLAGAISGLILILAGVLKLGKLTSYIPMPVITGFTSGIAVIIALGQIDNFFGVYSEGQTAIERIGSYFNLGFSPDLVTTLIGILVILFICFFPKKWSNFLPAPLIAIVISTIACMIFKVDVVTVGSIPKTLLAENHLSISDFNFEQIQIVLPSAISIALLGMIESLLCGASAGRMTGVRLRSDRELIAQGIGNFIIPFLGGIPATAAIARTSVAIKSGAKTRVAGVIHGIGLLISMFVLAPFMSNIPMSALAGVLMVTAFKMNEWSAIKRFFKGKFKGAISKFLITMIATIVFDLTIAITIGIVVALVLLVARFSKIEVSYDDVHTTKFGGTENDVYKNTMVVYITGPLLFSNSELLDEISKKTIGKKVVLFSVRGVSHMDISAGQVMFELIQEMQSRGVTVMFCGVSKTLFTSMQRQKILDIVGNEHFYWSATQALQELNQR